MPAMPSPSMSFASLSSLAVSLPAGHWWKLKGAPEEVIRSLKDEYLSLGSDHPSVKSVIDSLDKMLSRS